VDSVRVPASSDTRLLVAGVVAIAALVAYLAVAFANTHARTSPTYAPSAASPFAPFVPSNSKLLRMPRGRGARLAFRVIPTGVGIYGALVPTLVAQPPQGSKVAVGIWLRGTRPGRIGIEIDEFRSGPFSPRLVDSTVPATASWHHYTFVRRVKGRWLGLGMLVYRRTDKVSEGKQFAVRDLTVKLRGR